MLGETTRKVRATSGAYRIALVASQYNRRFVDGMLKAAKAILGAPHRVEVVRVPGSFEIPVVVARLARREVARPDAIVALGVIWQGATLHAEHIGSAVTGALMQVALETGVPVIHEVLVVQNEEQATARCLSAKTNRGTEAAQTALEMAEVMRSLGELRGPESTRPRK